MDVVAVGLAQSDALRKFAPRSNTIVWFGDSILEAFYAVSPSLSYHPRGVVTWAQDFLGHRFQTLNAAGGGVGGERTDEVLDRINTDVLAYAPGWCHVLAGTNDVGQAVALATIKANLTAIYNQLNVAGIKVIAGTIPPRSSYTGTQKADGEKLNAWIRDQARRRNNMVLVDYFLVLVNEGDTGFYDGTATYDGIHPSTYGAYKMGRLFADTLDPHVPGSRDLPAHNADTTNLIVNGRFHTGADAAAPTGWGSTWSVAPTFSKVPRSDGPYGNWKQMVVANTQSGLLSKNASVGSGLTVGDSVVGTVEYEIESLDQGAAAQSQGFYLQLGAYNGSTFTDYVYDHYWVPAGSENMPNVDREGVLRTPALIVPSGTTLVQLQIRMQGGGTFRLDRSAVFNLTTRNAVA